jgi:hypothetical protein
MNPEEAVQVERPVRTDVEVEVVRAQEEPPAVPEQEKNHWEQEGFLKEIAKVCADLEGERERFLFNTETRQIIETINNARRVEDFDRYTDSQLQDFISTLRNRVPQVEREMMTFINQLTRARTVQVDTVDFI